MSGLLHQQSNADSKWIEAEVMSVDVLRGFCEVKTLRGQKLSGVKWLYKSGGSSRAGDYDTPTVGDQVVISYSLSYPLIFGYLPRVRENNPGTINIDTGLAAGDTGNLSSSQGSEIRFGPGKPEDLVAGDRVILSEGGGLIAVLRMGTVMLRASRLAQIVISKFDDLVRIVGRNLEIFSDVYVDVAHNLKGRIYRFVGYSENHTKVRSDDYSYQEMYGDTALAEFAEQSSPMTGFPVANSKIRKIRVMNDGDEVYTQTLDLNGHIIDTVVHTGTAYRDHDGGQIQDRVTNGSVSTVTMNGSTIVLDQGSGASVVTLSNGSIVLAHGSATITLDSGKVDARFGSHFVTINSTGVTTG